MIGVLSRNRRKVLRRFVQLGVIALLLTPALGGSFFSGTLISAELFGVTLVDPLAALDYTVATRSWSGVVWLGALIVLVGYFLVGGRVFCSWVCPVHLFSEGARALNRQAPGTEPTVSVRQKYWVLAIVLLLAAVTAMPVFETVSPIGAITRNIALGVETGSRAGTAGGESPTGSLIAETAGRGPGLAFNASLMLIAFILLMDALVVKGWWCERTCPVGALYSLIGRWSPTRVRIDKEACNRCGDCVRVCATPAVLTPPVQGRSDWVLCGDCSNCLNCVDACTQKALALHFSVGGRK